MSKRIDELLAAEGAAAEAFEEDQSTPYPENVKISRRNPRSKVLQVRLTPDEFAAIERIADKRKLPASTVAREQLLRLIAEEASGGAGTPAMGLVAALTNIEALSSRLREELAETATAWAVTTAIYPPVTAGFRLEDTARAGKLMREETETEST